MVAITLSGSSQPQQASTSHSHSHSTTADGTALPSTACAAATGRPIVLTPLDVPGRDSSTDLAGSTRSADKLWEGAGTGARGPAPQSTTFVAADAITAVACGGAHFLAATEAGVDLPPLVTHLTMSVTSKGFDQKIRRFSALSPCLRPLGKVATPGLPL